MLVEALLKNNIFIIFACVFAICQTYLHVRYKPFQQNANKKICQEIYCEFLYSFIDNRAFFRHRFSQMFLWHLQSNLEKSLN